MKSSIRLVSLLVLLIAAPSAFSQVDFSDFCDVSAFTLNGETPNLTPNAGCVLRLTDDLSQSGSAFLTNPISLAADVSFSTAFSFRFTSQKNGGADGIVFVVQTVASNVGGLGGGIGYQGINNSVGVEFDNWFNSGSDPDKNHVGIDLNGSVNSVVTKSIVTEFDAGDVWYAWVDYNGTTDLLEVRLSMDSMRPVVPELSYTVDLVAVLGQTDAFIGFTSGTGAASAFHDVLTWQFRDSFAPIGDDLAPIPTLGTLGLVIVAGLLLILGMGRLRRFS
jgi:hypothetical protein